MTGGAELLGALSRAVSDEVGKAVTITGLHRLAGGTSQENWAFEAVWDEGGRVRRQALLLRREPANGVVDTSRAAEFGVLRALESTDVPAPQVMFHDDGKLFGRPSMVVRRHEGVADRAALRERDPLGLGLPGRLSLARQLVDVMAKIHRVDPAAVGLDAVLPPPKTAPGESELLVWDDRLARVQMEPQPALALARRWLAEHVPPPPERLVLVHGDFRPANVLIADGELSVVLDWELARLGDPLDDLGWYLAANYRHEHLVEPQWTARDVIGRYVERTGIQLDASALQFWRGMAAFRLAIMTLAGARSSLVDQVGRPFPPTSVLIRRLATDIVRPTPLELAGGHP